MKKKKIVARITEYAQHKVLNLLNTRVVREIFTPHSVHAVTRLITCRRGSAKTPGLTRLEVHGSLIGTEELAELGSDTWEVLECEVIIIPRRRLVSFRTSKDGQPCMDTMTAQQLYLGGKLLDEMENSYLIRSDPDSTAYQNETVEIVKVG